MRCARGLRGSTVCKRGARIRVLIVAIYRPSAVSGSARAPAAASVRVGYFPVEIREIFLLGVCAWLGARNLAATRSIMDSHPSRGSECRFIVCLYCSLFVFGWRLVATAAHLHRARSLRTILDSGDRWLLGRT